MVAGPSASAESHISGAGAAKTVPPLASRAARPPPAAVDTVRPLVLTPNFSDASLGLAAAARVRTISTWEKPSGWAVTWRSTSGTTSR
ncbi:hypothetical protein EFE23_16530 [Micromonospora solifontis]|uniref:Uncharacterized protein n=1 Tax=Micromonospora solifontis TaxID=2487138 RepID=A0ABX9WE34_9ACTN|nr:hypothetical protein EFE23_16530 [Micromonospora solifontis]